MNAHQRRKYRRAAERQWMIYAPPNIILVPTWKYAELVGRNHDVTGKLFTGEIGNYTDITIIMTKA